MPPLKQTIFHILSDICNDVRSKQMYGESNVILIEWIGSDSIRIRDLKQLLKVFRDDHFPKTAKADSLKRRLEVNFTCEWDKGANSGMIFNNQYHKCGEDCDEYCEKGPKHWTNIETKWKKKATNSDFLEILKVVAENKENTNPAFYKIKRIIDQRHGERITDQIVKNHEFKGVSLLKKIEIDLEIIGEVHPSNIQDDCVNSPRPKTNKRPKYTKHRRTESYNGHQ